MSDNGHFYTSHRIASTATNEGDSVFGKATGRKVFFRTIADCKIANNKIYEEWLVRDNLYLIQQLGFDPVEMAKRDYRYKNKYSLAYQTAAPAENETISPFDFAFASFEARKVASTKFSGFLTPQPICCPFISGVKAINIKF